ncbi:SIMPL domain-containing protein [Pedobacter nanyangensis]|uniref:SIMPL domain-containing protein n=1 Tax=Pedobacter nanyangensis TaxID=1562389 RepID=UPI000DE2D251|nr:SIMPL domain-containing protein [Pedobacter nanyangensis]
MKRLFAIALLAFTTLSTFNALAQQADLRRKITVTGTAETEVTPDIIYINISLKEYLKDGNSKKKVDITTLETQLFNAVQKAGIAKENLTINNLSSWNYQTEKRKNPDFLASKQYRLKVGDLNKFNLILEGVDAKGITNTYVESYDYSKIESLKKELKVKALLAAKEKAAYMVEALGDKLGNVLDIQDVGDNGGMMVPQYRNYAMKAEMAMDAGAAPEIDFKKIKLSFTVNTVFEIK